MPADRCTPTLNYGATGSPGTGVALRGRLAKVDARAWNSGDGPTAIFQYAVRWLRENDVSLPGITRLTRLVARVRDDATQRLWDTLYELLTHEQRFALDLLLEVSAGGRVPELERWRTGPSRSSGPGLVKALDLVSEVLGAGFGKLDLDAAVPRRRQTGPGPSHRPVPPPPP